MDDLDDLFSTPPAKKGGPNQFEEGGAYGFLHPLIEWFLLRRIQGKTSWAKQEFIQRVLMAECRKRRMDPPNPHSLRSFMLYNVERRLKESAAYRGEVARRIGELKRGGS